MRYDEFRYQLQTALQNVGLLGQCIGNPIETVDLDSMGRLWKVYVMGSSTKDTEPFDVTAKIAFNWDPFNTARSYTSEEDLLAEMLGRTKNSSKTKPRLVRVDLELRASLPYGSTTTIPDAPTFGSWADSIKQKLDKVITENKWRQERLVAVLGALEEINIESRYDSAGHLSLNRLSVAGFRMVHVPRVWDNSDRREAEREPTAELSRLAQKFKYSLDEWRIGITELARWIRYSPPPEDSKQIAPMFDEQEDENEGGGPETIH
jgi:hypothetical protein